MPCRSDHLQPNEFELEASKLHCLLDELNNPFPTFSHRGSSWNGMHPKAYNKGVTKEDVDWLTAKLCRMLRNKDVTNYSLEMQLWWRNHREVDAARKERNATKRKDAKARAKALAKLTDFEKELLELK